MSRLSNNQWRWVLSAILFLGGLSLLALVLHANRTRSIFENAELVSDVWFQVTLLDAYLGFFIFYGWVLWKESSLFSRLVWLVLILGLGNMATVAYLIIQIIKLPTGQPLANILRREIVS